MDYNTSVKRAERFACNLILNGTTSVSDVKERVLEEFPGIRWNDMEMFCLIDPTSPTFAFDLLKVKSRLKYNLTCIKKV